MLSFDPNILDPRIPITQVLDKDTTSNLQAGDHGFVSTIKFQKDPNVKRLFALKQPIGLNTKARYRTAYKKISEISRKIGEHPNFMQVHALILKEERQEEVPYLLMSHIDGETLNEYLQTNTLTVKAKFKILHQFKRAVLHLHERSVFPVDIGARNIMLTKNLTIKIIDFDRWQLTHDKENLQFFIYYKICEFAQIIFSDYDFKLSEDADLMPSEQFFKAVDKVFDKLEKYYWKGGSHNGCDCIIL